MPHVQEFDEYAPERFERLCTALAARGFHLAGTSGEVKAFGADVQYAYDAALRRLTFTVIKAPFLHSMAGFSTQLTEAIQRQS